MQSIYRRILGFFFKRKPSSTLDPFINMASQVVKLNTVVDPKELYSECLQNLIDRNGGWRNQMRGCFCEKCTKGY